jgi:hypothetical protein
MAVELYYVTQLNKLEPVEHRDRCNNPRCIDRTTGQVILYFTTCLSVRIRVCLELLLTGLPGGQIMAFDLKIG